MYRKIVVMLLLAVVMLTGCSTADTENSEQAIQVTQPVDETTIKTSEIIPDPEEMFPDAHVAILVYNKPNTYYQITNYEEGDYEAYVDACIEAGFDDIQFKGGIDGNEMFLAYDQNHEFRLDVGITPKTGIISITCSVVDKEE